MKRKIAIVLIVIVIVLALSGVFANVFSGTRDFEYSGTNYTSYIYYGHSSVSTYGYEFITSNAAMYWNHNTSKVVIVAGTLISNANRDYILITYTADPGVYGEMTPLDDYGVDVLDPNYDFHRAQINMYYNNINSNISALGMNSTDAAAFKRYCTAHEIGHALKAAHNSYASSYTIMRATWANYSSYYMHSNEYLYSIREKDNYYQVYKWGNPA